MKCWMTIIQNQLQLYELIVMGVSVEMFLNSFIWSVIPNPTTEYRIELGSHST
jgi:hypothetical protein